jgi:nicotinamide-nucleotide amidase
MSGEKVEQCVERVASLAQRCGWWVAAAESLTCGQLASRLAAGPEASSWLRGGVVAYSERVKFDLLGVEEGSVVTAACAEQMAHGAARLLAADVCVAATGVGGPGPEDGTAAGTVFVAVAINGMVTSERLQLPGPPGAVLGATVEHALASLAQLMGAAAEAETGLKEMDESQEG